jgi:hypothetical protein
MKSSALYSKNDYKESNREFSMVVIPLHNYLYDLDENIKIYDFYTVLRKVHDKSGKTIRSVAKDVKIHEITCSLYLSGKNRPSFRMLKKLSGIYGVDLLQIAFDGDYSFIIKKKITKLPRELTNDLAYYIGYLQGDGYLESDKKSFGFADEYMGQIEKMKLITADLFGIESKIYELFSRLATKPCYHLVVNSFIATSFISVVFKINKGIKIDLRIPQIMFENKEILKYYISGLYDADGTLPKHPDKVVQFFLDITMKDKVFMQEIKVVLKEFGIETLQLYERIAKSPSGTKMFSSWEIRIRRRSEMLKFLQIIGFHHPDKLRRQNELISMLL